MTLVVLMRYGVCTVQIRNECGSYRWDIASEEGSFDGLEQTKEGARSMNPFLRLNRVSVRKSSRSPMQDSNANEQTAQRERALLSPAPDIATPRRGRVAVQKSRQWSILARL